MLVWFCLLDIMLVLNIMGSPWIDQLNAIIKYFIPKFSLQKLDVSLLRCIIAGFKAIYLSFCNCSFLCKKIVSYITVVQLIIS